MLLTLDAVINFRRVPPQRSLTSRSRKPEYAAPPAFQVIAQQDEASFGRRQWRHYELDAVPPETGGPRRRPIARSVQRLRSLWRLVFWPLGSGRARRSEGFWGTSMMGFGAL